MGAEVARAKPVTERGSNGGDFAGRNFHVSKLFPLQFNHLPQPKTILHPPTQILSQNPPTVLTGTRIMSRMFVGDGGAGWRALGAFVGDEPHIRASENLFTALCEAGE